MKSPTLKLALLLIVAGASFSCSHSTTTNSSGGISSTVSGTYLAQSEEPPATYQFTLNTFPGNPDSAWTGTMITMDSATSGDYAPPGTVTARLDGPGTSYSVIEIYFEYQPNNPAKYNDWQNMKGEISLDTISGHFTGNGLSGGVTGADDFGPWSGDKQ